MQKLLDIFNASIAADESNSVLFQKLLASDIRLPSGKTFTYDMVSRTKQIIRQPSRFSGSKFGKFIINKGNK